MKTMFKKVSAAVMALAVMSTAAALVFNEPGSIAAEAETEEETGENSHGTHEVDMTAVTMGNMEALSTAGKYYLDGDITLNEEIKINSDVTVTICLNGHKIDAENKSRVFNIQGGSLTICDCSNGKGKITGGSADKGGGVLVKNASFILKGGTISGNEARTIPDNSSANGIKPGSGNGGGVYVDENGTFIMEGGKIEGNTANFGGGGVYVMKDADEFIMNKGEITGNTAINVENQAGGGGVYVAGNFTMNNGNISHNTAQKQDSNSEYCYGGGVGISGENAVFIMNNGTISENTGRNGGGIHMSSHGLFTMNGGSIENNIATFRGGGISMGTEDGKVEIKGGMIVGNKSEDDGGGIRMKGGTLLLDDKVNITNNHGKGGSDSNIYLEKPKDKNGNVVDNMITIGKDFEIPTNIIGVHAETTPDCTDFVNATKFEDGIPVSKKDDVKQNFASKYFKPDVNGEILVYDDINERVQLAKPHNPQPTEKAPTCTEDGSEDGLQCDMCYKYFTDTNCTTETVAPAIISALGHAYGNWQVTKPATYTEAGEEQRVCSRDASHVETRPLPMLTHATPVPPASDYSAPTSSAPASSDDSSSGESSTPAESSSSGESSAPAESNTAENSSFGENNVANDAPYTGAEISILPIAACVAAASAAIAKRSKENK